MLADITITNKSGASTCHQITKNALDHPTTGQAHPMTARVPLTIDRDLPTIDQDLLMIALVRLMTGRVLPTIGIDCQFVAG